ncbi:portal protein [Streptomyces phage phiScoe10]|nr:portal protein [Streptomyces phage phiScoe10]
MTDISPASLAKQLLSILHRDGDRLRRIDAYQQGEHDDPYMPPQADDEYRLLARRAVSNWMPLLVGTPAQALYVDGFRRGSLGDDLSNAQPDSSSVEWKHWQRSRLDARQAAVYRGALAFGHSFTLTERTKRGVVTKGLSAMKTAALFEDPANDDTPYAALTIVSMPKDKVPGKARLWDGRAEYPVSFKSLEDTKSVTVGAGKRHGASECPVTRFAAQIDLEGRTLGVIEPMIALQNRINQTVFDLLVAQTFTSSEVRYATGMAPPIERDEDGDPVLDENGQPKPIPMNHNARRFLFAEDSDVKFGSLPGGPLNGLIDSIDMSIRHLAAVSQTPPHHLLGQIANLSAEALLAAETALSRKIAEFRAAFGESWERVFRLAGELEGDATSAEDFAGEVNWRDMESRSLAQAADALGKLKEQLGIPARGLWKRVPGVTQNEIEEWESMREDEDPALALASSITRATPDVLPPTEQVPFTSE